MTLLELRRGSHINIDGKEMVVLAIDNSTDRAVFVDLAEVRR
jgi:translation elongation factor P/translation initiation factor 5A